LFKYCNIPSLQLMIFKIKKIAPNDPVDKLISDLNKGFVAIVEDKNKGFHGIITKIDLINYLRNGKY